MNTQLSANKETIGNGMDQTFIPVISHFLQQHPHLLVKGVGVPFEKSLGFWTTINTLLFFQKEEDALRLINLYLDETYTAVFRSFISKQ